MKRILIVSTERHSGKSLLSLAIGRSMQERGLRIAYMKPISFEVSYATGEAMDCDAGSVRDLLELKDELRDIAPVPLEGPFLREAIESGDRGFRNRITEAHRRVTQDRDFAVIEGRNYLGLGIGAGLSDLDLADLLSADVLLLCQFDGEEAIDRILCALRLFENGPSILGVILKDVPTDRLYATVEEAFVPFLADRGAEVLGIVPQDPRSRAVRVDDIAKRLAGRVLAPTGLDREVRHFVIGAMGVEASLRSFRRTPEFAVITGADRADIQRAALNVEKLRCLILTGNQRPSREIIDQAAHQDVAIILAGQNAMVTAKACGEMLERTWIRPGTSLEYAVDHVRSNIDVDRILEKATTYDISKR